MASIAVAGGGGRRLLLLLPRAGVEYKYEYESWVDDEDDVATGAVVATMVGVEGVVVILFIIIIESFSSSSSSSA